MRLESLVAFLALLAGTAPVFAQTAPQQQPAGARTAPNLNQMVCETQSVTGSRLGSQKICHTRAQWEEMRRDDHSETEHLQAQRTMDANGR